MKRILGICMALACFLSSFASGTSAVLPVKKQDRLYAADVLVPIGNTGKKISLLELSQIRVKEIETLRGRKMSLADKLGFKLAQRQLAKSIRPDGSLDNKKINKLAARAGSETGFHLGGFALGFFLGLIGVLIAYLIKDDLKSNRVKWAWIGLAVIVALNLIIVAALL